MLFLFCYNGPLCGDGRGEEICVPARRRLPGGSQGNLPGLLEAPGPRGAGRREGVLRHGADGAAQCPGHSPALRVALTHRGLESDRREEGTQVLAAGTAQSSPVPGDRAHPQV